MNVKIGGNNILYWGTLGLLFFHRKFTDLDFMAAVRPDLERIWAITRARGDVPRVERDRVRGVAARDGADRGVPGDVRAAHRHGRRLRRRDAEGEDRLDRGPDGGLRGARLPPGRAGLPDGAPDEDQKINPYAISLDPDRWEADGLFNGDGMSLAEARQTPAGGMENLFMEAIATPALGSDSFVLP